MYLSYDFGENFEHEVDFADTITALKKIVADKICGFDVAEDKAKDIAEYFVQDLDLQDILEDVYQEDLREYFESDAEKAYEEMLAERRELDDWYGTKNNVRGC